MLIYLSIKEQDNLDIILLFGPRIIIKSFNDQLKDIEVKLANLQAVPPNQHNYVLKDALCRDHT